MPEVSDQQYLLQEQYKNASNLNARVQLHTRFGTNKTDWQRWVFDRISTTPGPRVLELGCGPANLWHANQERIPASWDITLSDFSAGMLGEAKQTLHESAHTFAFRIVDAQSILFRDETFDIVIANHMLYHVPNRQKALSEIQRVLKKDGRFFAATNGQRHMYEIAALIRRVAPEYNYDTEVLGTFTLETAPDELAHYFNPVTLHTYDGNLEVTESQALIDYICSGWARKILTEEKIRAMRPIIEQEIATRGNFHITRSTGLFEAAR